MEAGLLAKPTHDTIVRLAPPLVITSEQAVQQLDILSAVIKSVCRALNRSVHNVLLLPPR